MQTREAMRIEVKGGQSTVVEVIEGDIVLSAGQFLVQAGAFANLENAMILKNKLCPKYNYSCGIVKEGGLYKLRFGYFATAEEAVKCADEVSKTGTIVFVGVLSEKAR
jgi:cell division septation protein DedD